MLRACQGGEYRFVALTHERISFLALPAGAFLSRDTLETPSEVVMISSACAGAHEGSPHELMPRVPAVMYTRS